MPLGKSEIRELANLARLKLDNQQTEKLSQELDSVLSWFDQIGGHELDGAVASVPASDSRLREDVAGPSLSQDEALVNAPRQKGGLIQVPGVMKR